MSQSVSSSVSSLVHHLIVLDGMYPVARYPILLIPLQEYDFINKLWRLSAYVILLYVTLLVAINERMVTSVYFNHKGAMHDFSKAMSGPRVTIRLNQSAL
jgi:hypothetical protein